jgi:hypothetical protein
MGRFSWVRGGQWLLDATGLPQTGQNLAPGRRDAPHWLQNWAGGGAGIAGGSGAK